MANTVLPTVNIDIEEEWAAANAENQRPEKESTFKDTNYLDVRLAKGDKERKIKIRLLPMDSNGGTPFIHVHYHNVEVHKDLVKPGQKPFKSFICLSEKYNPNINHEKFGNKCPFCESNNDFYQQSLKATDAQEKKDLQKISCSYLPKEAVICRCIERGKENEGVKFWKFNLKFDKSDPYNKILNLAKERKEEGVNILDLYNGRDLTLTIKPGNTENQTAIDIIESSVSTPISNDPEQIIAWLNDEKKWDEVFTAKPYEYLQLINNKKYPWFDRELQKWVDKEDYEARHEKARDEKEEAAADIDKKIEDATTRITTSATATFDTQVVEDIPDNDDIDEEDLPF